MARFYYKKVGPTCDDTNDKICVSLHLQIIQLLLIKIFFFFFGRGKKIAKIKKWEEHTSCWGETMTSGPTLTLLLDSLYNRFMHFNQSNQKDRPWPTTVERRRWGPSLSTTSFLCIFILSNQTQQPVEKKKRFCVSCI